MVWYSDVLVSGVLAPSWHLVLLSTGAGCPRVELIVSYRLGDITYYLFFFSFFLMVHFRFISKGTRSVKW